MIARRQPAATRTPSRAPPPRAWPGLKHASHSQVVTTNARKLLTVALSFILFPKAINGGFALSGVAVVAGIVVHQYSKNQSRASAASKLG